MKRILLSTISYIVSVFAFSLQAQDLVVKVEPGRYWLPGSGCDQGAFYALPTDETDPSLNADFREAVTRLRAMLEDPETDVLGVYICGISSPDGSWQNNLKVSRSRMEKAVSYVREMTGIPQEMIYEDVQNEGWDTLYAMLEKSDVICKDDVLRLIRAKSEEERKQYLKEVAGGKVWTAFLEDYFPQLRGIRFAVFCRDQQADVALMPADPHTDVNQTVIRTDTLYIRDTVYLSAPGDDKIPESDVRRPWMMGVKTNLLADAMAVPMGGVEIQLARPLSLEIQGWFTPWNILCPDEATRVYGIAPELRLWLDDDALGKGGFIGIQGRALWYTLRWTDGFLYQNGKQGGYDQDAGNHDPAWNVGLTYGYCFALGKEGRWAVELALGVGYGRYSHNVGEWYPDGEYWVIRDFQQKSYLGLTRASVNLAYRFPLRK